MHATLVKAQAPQIKIEVKSSYYRSVDYFLANFGHKSILLIGLRQVKLSVMSGLPVVEGQPW